MITREKLKKLNKENLIELILEMSELLTENQNRKYNQIVAGYLTDQSVNSHDGVQARMSDEFVSEKMAQIKIWIQQIDEGELYLNADEYEDYSSVIIPGLSEPPVRTLRATIPENESHIFR